MKRAVFFCLLCMFTACAPSAPAAPSPTAALTPAVSPTPEPLKEVINTMTYTEYDGAFMNPMKGFRANSRTARNYETLIHMNFAWDELEENAADTVQKIIDVCNERWSGLEYTSTKVIPRVYLDYPSTTPDSEKVKMPAYGRTYYVERRWPADMETGVYDSEEFFTRLRNFVKKLGEAWDNDPRVAYVESGIIGFWGEQHMPDLTDEMTKVMGDAFTGAFKNKKVMVRRADGFKDYTFGIYWDSFNHTDEEYQKEYILALGDRWKTQVIGGETAYDWGRFETQPGNDPNDTLRDPVHRLSLIDTIREVHANHLGWVADYSAGDKEVAAGAAEVQKALGYRFFIQEARYSEIAADEIKVSLDVVNTGSTPLYADWPIEFSLIQDGKIKYKYLYEDFPLSAIMPGDDWNQAERKYNSAPEAYTMDVTIPLSGLDTGDYMLGVCVPVPGNGVPCLRFANENYTVFGRTALGWVGVGKTPAAHGLDGYSFASFTEDDAFYRP